MSALPHFSDVDLLGYGKRIIDFDSQIADRTRCTLVSSRGLRTGPRNHGGREIAFRPFSKRPAPGRPKEMVSACGGQQDD